MSLVIDTTIKHVSVTKHITINPVSEQFKAKIYSIITAIKYPIGFSTSNGNL